MNKQNFSTEQYTLKHYDHEQSEVVFAGDRSSSDIIVFIHGAMMTYRIMAMFEPYFREYQMIFCQLSRQRRKFRINNNERHFR